MSGPSFLSIDLAFGRHRDRWELAADRPVLITGPNGSGKTTFVDGLLRTIYGFRRRADEDRRLYEAREPWDGDEFRSAVRLRTAAGEVLEWERDHHTDGVVVTRSDGTELFRGTANPGSGGSSDREYWGLVGRVFGLDSLEDYARTAAIGQGEMLGTTFGSELLRLAEGGHARLQAALERIAERHKRLTREPVSDDHRRLGRDRPLERDRAERQRVRAELAEARSAIRARETVAGRLEEVETDIDRLEAEVAQLEALHTCLLQRARVEAELAGARQRFDRLVDLREELERARREAAEADRTCEELGAAGDFPPDFAERLTELEALWAERDRVARELERLEAERAGPAPSPRDAGAAGLALLLSGGGATAATAGAAWGWLGLAIGLGLLAWVAADVAARRRHAGALDRRRRELEEEAARVAARVTGLTDGLPDAATLAPAVAAERRREFQRAQKAQARRTEAKRHLSEVMRRIERSPEARDLPGRPLPHLIADAGRHLNGLEAELEALEREAPSAPEAPYPASPRAAQEATRERQRTLAERRSERDRLLVDLDRAVRALADTARLEHEAEELDRRIDETERAARALRAAHVLLRDGYDAFRDHDEARLVRAVAERLAGLGEPELGPFRAEDGLAGATVGLLGRRLDIASPELSHGQRHLVMLAVRLGAADFLADGGPAAPLIVDEPFAHLDDRHAAHVWELLGRVAARRQVVVTTQEGSLLQRLGAEPDVRLRPGRVSNSEPPVRPRGETTGSRR